jgi:hypothetical protein
LGELGCFRSVIDLFSLACLLLIVLLLSRRPCPAKASLPVLIAPTNITTTTIVAITGRYMPLPNTNTLPADSMRDRYIQSRTLSIRMPSMLNHPQKRYNTHSNQAKSSKREARTSARRNITRSSIPNRDASIYTAVGESPVCRMMIFAWFACHTSNRNRPITLY